MSTADRLRRPLLGAGAGAVSPPRPEGLAGSPGGPTVAIGPSHGWQQGGPPGASRRWLWGGALGVVLLGSLALRLWGVRHGLPYAYNADENGHFVPKAIAFFNGDLNPHYFNNPPAFSYLLYGVFELYFGGRAQVSQSFALHPAEAFEVARVTAALLGTLAVWLLYAAARRLIDRRVALLAAALLGVAFLPVFYSHLALNDVPTLAPLGLSLLGTAGILRFGRRIDYLLAGIGLGLACATKYTAGIVLVPLIVAAAAQYSAPGGRRVAVAGILIAGTAALAAFIAANPYSVLDFASFRDGLAHQSAVTDDAAGKLGLTHTTGIAYYLWSLTWGLGWVPAVAAVVGIALLWRDERRLVAVLAPGPILYLIFMGSQGRYFGRWLIPVLPIVCILAAYAAVELADRLSLRRPALRPTLLVLGAVALCGQALVHSIHSGLTLSRADTRNLTRAWLVAHLPVRSRLVVEPVVPDQWAQDIGHPSPLTSNGNRWVKFPTSRSNVDASGAVMAGAGRIVNIEDYERVTQPALIAAYEKGGYCWVISGSTQSGRAAADPGQVPRAIAYYQRLGQVATVAYQATPFRAGQRPVPFNFDWSFDYYPLAYDRPGPLMTVYRLHGRRCAG